MRILFFFLALPLTAFAQKITIDAVNHHRVKTPVPVNIAKPGLGFYGLYDKSNGKTYPLQWENTEQAWFIMDDSL
ncbi:MAG TPA: hypothetical protein VFX73_04165, partial [Chitinophagaceae bacterium]|nr:hypothetical protein [Chitinophagaceae bacterium]